MESDGLIEEVLSAHQCVVGHYVQLHVLGCTPGIPFNLEQGYTENIRVIGFARN